MVSGISLSFARSSLSKMDGKKFTHRERRHKNSTGFESLQGPIVLDNRSMSNKPPSIVLGESIKAHFDGQYGGSSDLRGIKIVGHKEYSNEVINRGKMYLKGKDTEHCKFVPSVKQFHGIATKSSEPSNQISRDWTGKTRINPNESDIYNVESIMSRKHRLLSNEEQRNDIPCTSKGDKYYKEVDRERDFYKKGGLIPGSCIAGRGTSKTEIAKKDSHGIGNGTSKAKLSFKEKKDKELMDNELKELKDLNNSSAHLGQEILSWEMRTGSYLVRPEDENY